MFQQPHRRYNPLAREWVLVSPQRTKRPWLGQVEKVREELPPAYDPGCYLCPGNARSGGARNPAYEGAFVFDNDFPALLPTTPAGRTTEHPLLLAEGEPGICRVVCFSPRHDLSLPRLPLPAIRGVLDLWAEQVRELGALPQIGYVQIFENRGAMMGASNPHPHCQLWASRGVPNEVAAEQAAQAAHHARGGACLLCEYLEAELARGERLVCENERFVALVPFWAIWPFEVMVLPRRHLAGLDQLEPEERDALASLLRRLTTRYENLFESMFPYSMGFHGRPLDGAPHPEWHLHLHFLPPLLRSATVRKFMVGYELLGTPQRDLTAETAAERLRGCSEVHYLER